MCFDRRHLPLGRFDPWSFVKGQMAQTKVSWLCVLHPFKSVSRNANCVDGAASSGDNVPCSECALQVPGKLEDVGILEAAHDAESPLELMR